MGRKSKVTLEREAREYREQSRVTAKAMNSYLRVTLERGLQHEPFSLRKESIDTIDFSDLTMVLKLYNGQKFILTVTEVPESEEANVSSADSTS